MYRKSISLYFFGLFFSLNMGLQILCAQTSALSGTVKNSQGQPIPQASILLQKQQLTAVTNTSGKFSINLLTGLSFESNKLQVGKNISLKIQASKITLHCTQPTPLRISLFSPKGQLLKNLYTGTHAIGELTLNRPADKMPPITPILRITSKAEILFQDLWTDLPHAKTKNRRYSLKKNSLSVIDTIQITAPGYIPKKVPLFQDENNLVIVLDSIQSWSGQISLGSVYFAQTHVLEDTAKLFKLVGNREALIKAHITSPIRSLAPPVVATLSLNDKNFYLSLTGPDTLPSSIDTLLGNIHHSYKNSFTAIIPKEWVQTGLKISIQAGNKSKSLNSIKIGAPTLLKIQMMDIHYFRYTPSDYPKGWLPEFESKRPVANIQLDRLAKVVFPELVIPPRANLPAVRINSKLQYRELTGQNFDGEQAAALQWTSALKLASGTAGRIKLYYLNIYGADAGGQAGGFSGVGNGNSLGILNHEMGHSLSLPHWGDAGDYPYKGNMVGGYAPNNYKGTHAGPTWAFDLPSRKFISPYTSLSRMDSLVFRKDPMQGGGVGDQDPPFLMNHFSDYSVSKMQNYLESHVVVWNDSLKSYASWNGLSGNYSTPVSNNGVQFPLLRDVQVISIMAAVSAVTPQANLVYPPIGPYTAGMISLFDPQIASDRAKADSLFCPTGGCDISLRILQGGTSKIYMLPISLDTLANPLSPNSLSTRALNLLASDGIVTKIEMLSSPNAEKDGLPTVPKILDVWEATP